MEEENTATEAQEIVDIEQETTEIDQEVQESEQQEETTQQETDTEAHARRLGWVPESEFRGGKSKHISAEDFIKRGENELPVVKENLRRLDRKYKDLEGTLADFKDHHSKVEAKAYNKAKRDIIAQQAIAAEDGDIDKFRDLEKQRDSLEQEQSETTKAPVQKEQIPLEVEAFIERNEWFKTDVRLQKVAEDYHGRLLQSQPNLSMADNLSEVERIIKEEFPERTGQEVEVQKKRVALKVASNSRSTVRGKERAKTYNDLPSEAKDCCDNFVRKGLVTREQYTKEYFN
jgi:hypothetical protein